MRPQKHSLSNKPEVDLSATLLDERWILAAMIITSALYVALLLLRPSGEGWGRGWNLVAFWLYASPAAVVTGAVALWRAMKSKALRPIASGVGVVALVFPLVAMLVIQARA